MKASYLIPVLLLATILSGQPAIAQIDSVWSRTFGSLDNEDGYCGIELPNGNILVVADVWVERDGFYDWQMYMLSADGDSLWSRKYGRSGNEHIHSIVACRDGGYLLVGHSESNRMTLRRLMMVKLDAEGHPLWTKEYGDMVEREFEAKNVIEDENGEFVIVGNTTLHGRFGLVEHPMVMRISADGDSLNGVTVNADYHFGHYARAGVLTSDGGVAITGYYREDRDTTTAQIMFLIKLDADFQLEWTRTYLAGLKGEGTGIVQHEDGGFFISGAIFYPDPNMEFEDAILLRTNSEGDSLWTAIFGGFYPEVTRHLIPGPNNGIIMAGAYSSQNQGYYRYWLISIDEEGVPIWHRRYGGVLHDVCNWVAPTRDGGYVMIGQSESYGNGREYYNDVWVLKLAPPDNVEQKKEVSSSPAQTELTGAYPNPFNSSITVMVSVPTLSPIAVSLIDISGRTLREWTESPKKSGEFRITFDGNGLVGGTYWLRLEQSGSTVSQRLVLIR